MGYWSRHPFSGDLPYDYRDEMTSLAINLFVKDYVASKSDNSEIEGIGIDIISFLDEADLIKDKNDEDAIEDFVHNSLLYNHQTFEMEIWKKYKYDILNEYKETKKSFVIPWQFILCDVHVNKTYLPILEKCFDYTNWKQRNYDEWDGKTKEHPMYYVSIAKKYFNILFDEDNNELNDAFVKSHPEICDVYPTGLLATIASNLEKRDLQDVVTDAKNYLNCPDKVSPDGLINVN